MAVYDEDAYVLSGASNSGFNYSSYYMRNYGVIWILIRGIIHCLDMDIILNIVIIQRSMD